jgi:hypothetical protein
MEGQVRAWVFYVSGRGILGSGACDAGGWRRWRGAPDCWEFDIRSLIGNAPAVTGFRYFAQRRPQRNEVRKMPF